MGIIGLTHDSQAASLQRLPVAAIKVSIGQVGRPRQRAVEAPAAP